MDEGLKSRVHKRMVETGEWKKVRQHLEQELKTCGWQDELFKYCVKVVRDRGVENVTLDDLLSAVAPVARKNVPEELKDSAVTRIRSFLEKDIKNLSNK